jgi:hypothetical protein
MTYRATFLQSLKEIRFEPNELAYLALTSKPELQVRDRLAYRLYRRGLIVAREWRRIDLVILEENQPRAVLECKATSGRAARRAVRSVARPWYEREISGDMDKARKLASGAEIFTLLIITFVLDPIPPELRGLVKYPDRHTAAADRNAARTRVATFLNQLGPAESWVLENGEAFGMRVTVEGWLCGPVNHSKGKPPRKTAYGS